MNKPVTLGPFLGVNNRAPDTSLHVPKVGDFVRQSVNADLLGGKTFKLRPGYAQKLAGTGCHSLYGDGGDFGCYADGASLWRVRIGPAGLSREQVRSDLTAGALLSYARIGSVLYYSNAFERGMLGGSSASSDWGTLPDLTDPASPAYLWRPMPAGHIVRTYKGRLLVARGRTLFYSEPYAPNVYRPAKGYIPFLADIALVVPMADGVFLAADKTYWLPGDLAATRVNEVLGYGAIAGTDARAPDKSAMWFSPRGMIRGQNDGTAVNLQEKNVATDGGARGATLFRESDGAKKAISAVSGRDASLMAATSWMEAEILRKEVTL